MNSKTEEWKHWSQFTKLFLLQLMFSFQMSLVSKAWLSWLNAENIPIINFWKKYSWSSRFGTELLTWDLWRRVEDGCVFSARFLQLVFPMVLGALSILHFIILHLWFSIHKVLRRLLVCHTARQTVTRLTCAPTSPHLSR